MHSAGVTGTTRWPRARSELGPPHSERFCQVVTPHTLVFLPRRWTQSPAQVNAPHLN